MKILTYPDEKLRQKASEVTKIDKELKRTAAKMYEVMITHDGAGLAATQVGVPKNYFVMNSALCGHSVIINPRWHPHAIAIKKYYVEGCLSFPGWLVPVARYDAIRAEFIGIDGKPYRMEMTGFAAHVFQHETEHLGGILMIDHLNDAQKRTLKERFV